MTTLRNSTRTHFLAAFSLVLLSLISGCAQAPALDDGVMKATQLYEREDYKGVIALLQPMAARNPNMSTTSWDLLGQAYFKQRQYPEAAAALEKATAPGLFSGMPFGGRRADMNSNGWLGWSYFNRQDYGRARAAFDKALAKSDFRRDPGWDESAWRGRAWVRYYQGDFQGAAEDLSAAQRNAQANPGVISAAIRYDQNMALAYINLALNRDDQAQNMLRSAEAVAKNTSLPASLVNQDLAPIYLMLGQRDQAYRLWGATSSLGIGMQDENTRRGAHIVEVLDGSPAQQAGLMPGDFIVALDSQPVVGFRGVLSQIGARQPGQKVELALLRNRSPINITVTLAGPDALIAKNRLLQPVLKVRSLPAAMSSPAVASSNTLAVPPSETLAAMPPIPPPAAPAGSSIMPVEIPPPAAEVPEPQVETPVPPELRIDSIRVEPDPVPAGERFEVKMKLFVLDQDVREKTVAVRLRYIISKDGKELARFDPGAFQALNGVPSPLSYTTWASKTPGDYVVRTELEMGALQAQSDARFSIR